MGADPTWPNRARYSIPCDVTLGSGGGGGAAGTHRGSGARGAGAVRESGSVVRVCVVFSPYLYHCCCCSLCLLFLLNCPYPDPPVSASFFPFSSAPRRWEGRPRGAFCCRRQPKPRQYLHTQEYGNAVVLCPAETCYGNTSKNQKQEQTGGEATWGFPAVKLVQTV